MLACYFSVRKKKIDLFPPFCCKCSEKGIQCPSKCLPKGRREPRLFAWQHWASDLHSGSCLRGSKSVPLGRSDWTVAAGSAAESSQYPPRHVSSRPRLGCGERSGLGWAPETPRRSHFESGAGDKADDAGHWPLSGLRGTERQQDHGWDCFSPCPETCLTATKSIHVRLCPE